MTLRRDFAYAQARLQARHGTRPREDDWRALDGARTFDLFLERARLTVLRRWSERLDATMSSHAIEATLRREAERAVHEVARWVPPAWRDAVAWMAVLPTLSLVDGALGDAPLPAWAAHEPLLAPLVGLDPPTRRTVLATTAAAPLVTAGESGGPLLAAWVAHWRGLWPADAAVDPDLVDLIETVVRRLDAHRRDAAAEPNAVLRDALERILIRRFRRGAGRPLAAVAHVGLLLVDLDRFRGAIVRRSLFAAVAEEAA